MNVRLNKAGQDGRAARVYVFINVGINRFTNFDDAPITNQHITAHDGAVLVHRHNRAVSDEN